jgi:hypothetical protein
LQAARPASLLLLLLLVVVVVVVGFFSLCLLLRRRLPPLLFTSVTKAAQFHVGLSFSSEKLPPPAPA